MIVFEETGTELIEKARELKGLRVNLISLVKRAANRKRVIIKGDGSWEFNGRIITKSTEARKVYACVYEPDTVDTQNDYATMGEIEKAAHEFLGAGRVHMVDHEHDYNPDKGTVVESFILRGSDPNFVNVKKGAWCVAIELSAAGMSIIDEIDGVSLAGSAARKSDEQVSVSPLFRVSSVTKTVRPLVRHRQPNQ